MLWTVPGGAGVGGTVCSGLTVARTEAPSLHRRVELHQPPVRDLPVRQEPLTPELLS